MSSRAWLAIVVAAVVFGAIGYYYGTTKVPEQPVAAPKTVAEATAAPSLRDACRVEKRVTYDDSGGAPTLTIEAPKDLTVEYPKTSPGQSAVCWDLAISDAGEALFDSIQVIQTSRVFGANGRPILVGSPFFGRDRLVVLRFHDRPRWDGGDEHRIGYRVVGFLKTGGEIQADPDIIIKKPPGGFTQ